MVCLRDVYTLKRNRYTALRAMVVAAFAFSNNDTPNNVLDYTLDLENCDPEEKQKLDFVAMTSDSNECVIPGKLASTHRY